MHFLISPADFYFFKISSRFISILIAVFAVSFFVFVVKKRFELLKEAQSCPCLNNFLKRTYKLFWLWLMQVRQPRYMLSGILHIVIFFGFLILSIKTIDFVLIGFSNFFKIKGSFALVYNPIKDVAASLVFIACIIAAIRRAVFKPKRYLVPEKYGKNHTKEAVFVLFVISVLMLSESLFEASYIEAAAYYKKMNIFSSEVQDAFLMPFSLVWFFQIILSNLELKTLQYIYITSYYVHDIAFFFFLCFLPFGKHFHVLTSVFNVFFMKLERAKIKPVRYNLTDEEINNLEVFGVKKLQDFTWKHILDFYSCADCGRCSDVCPANAVKRPLSPRFISIKARDLIFKNYPVLNKKRKKYQK